MPALMFQGTGSDVGKSVLVAGFCRLLTNRGLRVKPFKPQNMSNNAAATPQGEIGRAQALQAIACRVEPHVDMNPVLIKPQSDTGAQLIVHGRMAGTLHTSSFSERRRLLLDDVMASYQRLRAGADIVVVEGAGSPAETNLRAGDIANMGFARAADVPVVLIGDIDRGGVIASLVGTRTVLEPEDVALIRGFIINKFRGDVRLFEPGYRDIEQRTGWQGLGIVPWLAAARRLPAEDAVVLDQREKQEGGLTIAVPMLSRIANFDDFDALRQEPGVRLMMVPPGEPLPAAVQLIILPGTKATIADLVFLRAQGWDIDLAAHLRRGGHVLGVCGGYQMLGRAIADPEGLEGPPGAIDGLGYLPLSTTLTSDKRVTRVAGIELASRAGFEGYEIHAGRTVALEPITPLLRFADGETDGAVSSNGKISGCYVHGLFDHPDMRAAWLARFGARGERVHQSERIDHALDELARELQQVLDVERLLAIAGTAS